MTSIDSDRTTEPQQGQVAAGGSHEPVLVRIDRDPVHAGDDLTSHTELWTFPPEVTLDGLLVAVASRYRRANVHGGAAWLAELSTARGMRPLAVIVDHGGPAQDQPSILQLLPRVAGRRLRVFSALEAGAVVEVYLRYLVNARLRPLPEIARSPSVAGSEPTRIVMGNDKP